MKLSVLVYILYVIVAFLMVDEVLGKKKGLHVKKPKPVHVKKPKPIHVKKPKVAKKVKRFFAVKHHHKKHESSTTTTISSTTMIAPTLTTFTTLLFSPTPVLMTITDRDYNYFFGYAATVGGVQYYNSPKFLVAGRKNCGCADSHPIIVTTYPEDEFNI